MTEKAVSIISNICERDKSSNRANILAYEEIAKTLPQIDIPVKHYIHGGMYGREIVIPKGTLLTGQIYKFDHFDVMIDGDVTVSTDTGEVKRFTGYNCFSGMSGKKRAGYAHKDTTWITFHPFDGQNIKGDEIQRFLTAESFEELEEFTNSVNQYDYNLMLADIGMTEKEVRLQVECETDLGLMPSGFDNLRVGTSMIEGSGLFSNKKIILGDLVGPSRIKGLRTLAGRFTNHALNANSAMIINDDGDVDLLALRDIEIDEEITVNYRDVINHREVRGDLCRA